MQTPLEQRFCLFCPQMLFPLLPRTVLGTWLLSEDFPKEIQFVCRHFVDWPPLLFSGPAGQPRPPTSVSALVVHQAHRFTQQGAFFTFNKYILLTLSGTSRPWVVSLCPPPLALLFTSSCWDLLHLRGLLWTALEFQSLQII